MFEVEFKMKVKNVEDVETKILELGGICLGEVREVDVYFNHPCKDFKLTDEALRIRRVNNKTYLTYKGSKIGRRGKVRFEEDVKVGSLKAISTILKRLGFREVGVVKKVRRSYIISGVTLHLDSVEGLGTFIEVELKTSMKKEVPKAIDTLRSILDSLGLRGRSLRKSYLEMLIEKNS